MRISLFCGTRPEAIKLAPVVHALQHHPHLKPHLCITGQHTDLLTPMLEFFQLQPNVHLRWERLHRSLPELTSRLTEAIDGYLEETKPDMVLVEGDTASTFTAALTAFYHQIPLGHIEAGLRTGSLQAPFPEEAYRQLTTRLADLHFASTPSNRQHLLDEGISAEKIHLTGNTVVDALRCSTPAISFGFRSYREQRCCSSSSPMGAKRLPTTQISESSVHSEAQLWVSQLL